MSYHVGQTFIYKPAPTEYVDWILVEIQECHPHPYKFTYRSVNSGSIGSINYTESLASYNLTPTEVKDFDLEFSI